MRSGPPSELLLGVCDKANLVDTIQGFFDFGGTSISEQSTEIQGGHKQHCNERHHDNFLFGVNHLVKSNKTLNDKPVQVVVAMTMLVGTVIIKPTHSKNVDRSI